MPTGEFILNPPVMSVDTAQLVMVPPGADRVHWVTVFPIRFEMYIIVPEMAIPRGIFVLNPPVVGVATAQLIMLVPEREHRVTALPLLLTT